MRSLNDEAGCPSKLLACDRVQLGQPQLCVVYCSKRLRRRSRKHLLGGITITMSDVAERIQLVEAARAHELLERGGQAGKVVLVASA